MKDFFRTLAYRLSLFGYFKQTWRKYYNLPANIEKLTQVQQHQYLMNLLAQPRYADPKRLHRHELQAFSQNGEDGVIMEIFRRIGTTDKRFVEIGVGDGLENCTVNLLTQGWHGLWVDGDGHAIASIRKTFYKPIAEGRLALKQSLVTAENISETLTSMNVPAEFDLLSLDIDRNTSFAWRALHKFKPRAAVIEYNSTYPPDVDWTVEYEPNLVYNCTSYLGGSLKALERIGAELGYALVGCETVGVNAFFVRKDLVGDKFAAPFTAENHYEPPRLFLLRRDGHPRCFTDIKPK